MNGRSKSRAERTISIKPFLRWVGGKQQIVTKLVRHLPSDVFERRYLEPFAGGASLFFRIAPSNAVLSDANAHLISCYKFIRDKPETVARHVAEHKRKSGPAYYYAIRSTYNRSSHSAAQAARFLYLNRACFNGIFRVNRRGEFNVPYGRKDPLLVPDKATLLDASALLSTATLRSCTFDEALSKAAANDFVYLDPPYPPLNGTAYFTHYTADRFTDDDQERLAGAFAGLDRVGAKVLLSNADTPLIRRLYAGFHVEALEVTRFVTCRTKKHRVSELVITNYDANDRVIDKEPHHA